MSETGVKPFLGFCSLVLALIGCLDMLTNFEENSCDMTWMFEKPQYIPIRLAADVRKRFPRYQLVVYGEGSYAKQLRKGNGFRGMPIVFVPGNAGSHRQVRSIGSVLRQKTEMGRLRQRFDVFSVDFRGELSGLYGEVLGDQTGFLHECIKRIFRLYNNSDGMGLVLMGHSMGGAVARALFTLPDFDSKRVSLILTYATPHHGAVALLDKYTDAFYGRLRETWTKKRRTLSSVTVVSVGGGDRDILVRTDLTRLPPSDYDISIATTAVPSVWASTDHVSITWCQQLVVATARAFFDLVEKDRNELSTDPERIRKVVRFHFVRQPFGKQIGEEVGPEAVRFGSGGEWIEKFEASWRYTKGKLLSSVSIVIPLYDQDSVVLLAAGVDGKEWLFGCTTIREVGGRQVCTEGVDLSRDAETVPSRPSTMERRLFQADAFSLKRKGFKSLLVRIPATGAQRYSMWGIPVPYYGVSVVGERYKKGVRTKRLPLPSPLSALWWTPTNVLSVPITEGAVFYNLTLEDFKHVLQAYVYTLEPRVCRSGTQGRGFVRYVVPWSHEDRFFHASVPAAPLTPMPLKIYNPVPEGQHHPGVRLHLYLDPECSYVLSAQFSLKLALGQAMRHYASMLPSYAGAQLLAALSVQLSSVRTTGLCLPVTSALNQARTVPILVVVPSVFQGLMWPLFGTLLPTPDDLGVTGAGNLALRSALYAVSVGLVVAVGAAFAALAILFGHLWMRLMAFWRPNRRLVVERQAGITWKRNVLGLVCILLIVATTTSAGFGLVLGCSVAGLLLAGRCGYQRALEDRKGRRGSTTGWHLHLTLVTLWFLGALLALPAAVTWARNLPYALRLPNDPHFSCTIIVLASAAVLWQDEVPVVHRLYYEVASRFLYGLSFLCVLYCPVTLYAINYFVALAFLTVALQQVLGSDDASKRV